MPNQKVKLSRTTVERLLPGPARYIVWDTDIPGFGVRVSPASVRAPRGVRTYILQYRLPGIGRSQPSRMLTLGRHGVITADQARDLAEKSSGRVRAGGDPARERSLIKSRETVARLVELNLTWLRRHRKPGPAAEARRILRTHVVPAIGNMAVADVQARDVEKITDRLELQGKKRTAGVVVQVCRAMFNRAELDKDPWNRMRPPGTNPCAKMAVHLGNRRKRALSIEELVNLGQAVRGLAAEGESPWLIALFLLLLLTGARLREIMHARWEWIDWRAGVIRLPDSKTGEKAINLSPPAIAALERIPHLDDNPYIICGTKAGRPLIAPYKGFRRIWKRAGIAGVRPHDLRRTYASMGLGEGLTLEQIGALLGHSTAETTKGYAFLQSDPARESSRLIGEGISRLLDGPQQLRLFKGSSPHE